tara:strand:- start:31755 stop:32348 length:594 start_codon:yes stop_codon:yes gene_type:complete
MKFSKKEEYLRRNDKKLKKIIDSNGHIKFKPKKDNQFDTIVGIVISQFISTSAANSILNKIKTGFNTENLKYEHFYKLSILQIKKLGVSTNKAKTIKELSKLYAHGEITDLHQLPSKELNERLNSIFGIGPWSINMFEIFAIGKLNIFSSKDAGLRLAMNKLDMIKNGSKWINYDIYANRWSPYKTIACLHLWKMID